MQDRKPTINDVARGADVSRATASRAINKGPGVSEAVRFRVCQVAKELGYTPNFAARTLASGRQNTIDLIVVAYDTDASRFGLHPYFGRVVAGMMDTLSSTGTHLRLRMFAESQAHLAADAIADTTGLGAVLVNVPPPLATRLHQRCKRVISLGATAPHVPAVEAENVLGAQEAVGHLHSLGRRHVAAIHGPTVNTCAESRRIGYLNGIHEVGQRDISGSGNFSRETAYLATTRLIEAQPDIDGVFAACDLMAAGAIQALTAAGRRVPDDVSVVGFDDSVIATCTNPPMTTVRLPVEEMAAAATRKLLDGGTADYWRGVFAVNLIVRDSSAAIPALS
jgi:DNA-binding LacI/PurR family transcriptional regulator